MGNRPLDGLDDGVLPPLEGVHQKTEPGVAETHDDAEGALRLRRRCEPQGVSQIRNIQMFDGTDDDVHTIVGLRSQSCARMEAKGWAKKSKSKIARVLLQVERPT